MFACSVAALLLRRTATPNVPEEALRAP
jgi:hypothetical protein